MSCAGTTNLHTVARLASKERERAKVGEAGGRPVEVTLTRTADVLADGGSKAPEVGKKILY